MSGISRKAEEGLDSSTKKWSLLHRRLRVAHGPPLPQRGPPTARARDSDRIVRRHIKIDISEVGLYSVYLA